MYLTIHEKAAESFNSKGEELLDCLTKKPKLQPKPSPFPKTPLAASFGPGETWNHIISSTDPGGHTLEKFFPFEDELAGLDQENYPKLVRLCEKLQARPELKNYVSIKSVTASAFNWLRERKQGTVIGNMVDYVLADLGREIMEVDVVVPIAGAVIESSLTIGEITIKPFPKDIYDKMRSVYLSTDRKRDEEETSRGLHVLEDKRMKMEGKASAWFHVTAEPDYAGEVAINKVEDVLALLRLFTSSNLVPGAVSQLRPLGFEYVRQYNYFIVGSEGVKRSTEGIWDEGLEYFALSDERVKIINSGGLELVQKLMSNSDINTFEKDFVRFLIKYSRHCLAADIGDKLIIAFGALDSFLLKNYNENIQQSVAERVAFATGISIDDRLEIIRDLKSAYDLRSRAVHHGSTIDDIDVVSKFLKRILLFIIRLLQICDKFKSREEFFEYLEQVKYGGGLPK